VGRLGEHVHRPHLLDPPARPDEGPQVPPEGPRVAGDVGEPPRPQAGEPREDRRRRALPGRVEDRRVEAALPLEPPERVLGPGLHEPGAPDPVEPRRLDPVLDRLRVLLHGDHAGSQAREREGEEAHTGVEVEDAAPGPGIEGPEDDVDELPRGPGARLEEGYRGDEEPDARDLLEEPLAPREPPREAPEDDAPLEMVRVEVEAGRRRRRRAAGRPGDDLLGDPLEARELPPRGDEDRLGLAGLLAHAHEDVPGNAGAGSIPRDGRDAFPAEEVPQPEGDGVPPLGVDAALLHRDQILRPGAVVTDHRLAGLAAADDEVDLAPERPGRLDADRRPDGHLRAEGDAEDVREHGPLQVELLGVGDVLPRAAAAGPEVRAGRPHAVGGGLLDPEEARAAVLAPHRDDLDLDLLARDRAGDEEDVVAVADDRVAVERHGGNREAQPGAGRGASLRGSGRRPSPVPTGLIRLLGDRFLPWNHAGNDCNRSGRGMPPRRADLEPERCPRESGEGVTFGINYSNMVDDSFKVNHSSCLEELSRRLEEPAPGRLQLLVGPRQIGKTTLLLELTSRLGESASYAACDEPRAALPGFWETMWNEAESRASAGKAFLFLDEVQHIPDWSGKLKGRWDRIRRHRIPVQVVASGSSARR
jgi:hypothetical protein